MQVMFVTSYFEPDSGAAAVRLSRLAKMLGARGHEITVLTAMPHYPHGEIGTGYRGKFALIEDRDGVRVIRTWLWATPSPRIGRRLISQTTLMLTAMLRGLALPRPDVVVIEAQPVLTSLAGILLSHLKRVRYVLNVSDLWPDHLLSVGALSESSISYRLARRVVDGTYRGAAGIVAMSPAWAGAIRQCIGSDSKMKIIHNGVDLVRFHPGHDVTAFRRAHQLGNHKIVSFIGTFATQYDFKAMLAVVGRFNHRPDVCFVFIGQGSQDGILRERLAGGDLARCRWIKWIDHTEMPLAWAATHVAYWAMRKHQLYSGTIPAKLYEALASGVPVAAATEGESEAMIKRSGAGLTAPCDDVDGLVDATQRLLDDAELHGRCSQSGRAYAEAHFDPEKVTSAYEEFLLSVRE